MGGKKLCRNQVSEDAIARASGLAFRFSVGKPGLYSRRIPDKSKVKAEPTIQQQHGLVLYMYTVYCV